MTFCFYILGRPSYYKSIVKMLAFAVCLGIEGRIQLLLVCRKAAISWLEKWEQFLAIPLPHPPPYRFSKSLKNWGTLLNRFWVHGELWPGEELLEMATVVGKLLEVEKVWALLPGFPQASSWLLWEQHAGDWMGHWPNQAGSYVGAQVSRPEQAGSARFIGT